MHQITFLVVALSLLGCAYSWQEYVNNNLVGVGLSQGAIIGLGDGKIWAKSKNFNPTATEIKALRDGFSNSQQMLAKGLYLNGVKYLVIKADDRSIYGKKGTDGAACVRTGTTIVIGVYNKSIQPGKASSAVEKLADYLIEQGY